ncbi:hypothetical protein SAMN05518672_102641 [Chitinophaga sp. CF118]|uniref:hypothetical protein n=1 Tax=Chitinophaga sp. CF118 TaxID=1884367 RepID=UPI0008E2DE5C|nr:hypothetical protein [Chitinophaga sp. CF118]SFD61838.1 hypothetical protein SAMN05518672_102641 [Chitinophaga sp. CF118]
MKKLMSPILRSKSAILLVLIAGGISLAIPACKKDSTTESGGVTEDEAGNVISQAITSQGGVMVQTSGAVGIANGYGARIGAKASDECGVEKTENVSFGVNDSLRFSYAWKWKLTCTDSLEPKALSFSAAGRIKIITSGMSVNDSSVASFSVSGLEPDSSNLLFNQTFNRTGTLAFTNSTDIINTRSYATTFSYVATDVKVNKETGKIISGTAAINYTGTSITGKTFSYSGTITYGGDNKGVLKLKSGKTINLIWYN